jgi:hypothetical protein
MLVPLFVQHANNNSPFNGITRLYQTSIGFAPIVFRLYICDAQSCPSIFTGFIQLERKFALAIVPIELWLVCFVTKHHLAGSISNKNVVLQISFTPRHHFQGDQITGHQKAEAIRFIE